mmetsp:Transcript_8348/g.23749  ORF Transcript_8348/g.23749 Transcript_8348/m.23749 type:complete len:129 (+) Transcript_8348:892-1278(+)
MNSKQVTRNAVRGPGSPRAEDPTGVHWRRNRQQGERPNQNRRHVTGTHWFHTERLYITHPASHPPSQPNPSTNQVANQVVLCCNACVLRLLRSCLVCLPALFVCQSVVCASTSPASDVTPTQHRGPTI